LSIKIKEAEFDVSATYRFDNGFMLGDWIAR